MKIAIAGAHRVGKTTLTEELLEHLPEYELKAEPYYELEEAGYLFAEKPDVDDFIKQFEYAVKHISTSGPATIFDRCPIDMLAYIHAIDPARSLEALFEKAYTSISEIDLLVLVPIEEPDLILCEKSDFPKLRRLVDEILHDWMGDFDVQMIEVSGSLLNRRAQVLKKMSEIMK